MKWRIVKAAVGIVLTVVVTLGMFAFGNGFGKLEFEKEEYSETFLGALSDTSYKSKVESVKAFLEKEIKGATSTPEYIGYEKIEDLTASQVRKLDIDYELKGQVESAELVSVFYKCPEDEYHNYNNVEDEDDDEEATEKSNVKTIESCIVKMVDGYRYYAYLSNDGEALTNSYFKTVLDGSKYLNCTSTTTLNMRTVSDNMVSDANYRQIIKFDDDIACFDQDLPGMKNKMFFTEDNGGIEVYLEHPIEKDGKYYSLSELNDNSYIRYEVYLIKGGEQIAVDTLSVMQDVTDFMFMMELDASYFVKTDYGFSMPDNKYKEVCKLMVDSNTYEQMTNDWQRYHVYFHSDYYVSEGRLAGSKTVLTMSNGDDIFALTINVEYTDFGTTEVTLPEEAED